MPPTVFINWKQNFRLNQCCFPLVYKYEMQLFSDSKPIRVGNNLCVHLPTAVAQRTKLHAFYKTDYFQNSKHRFETLSKTQIDKSRPQTLAIENKKATLIRAATHLVPNPFDPRTSGPPLPVTIHKFSPPGQTIPNQLGPSG